MKNIIDKSNRKYLVYSICFLPLVMLAIQSIFNGLCFAFGSDYWNIAFMDRGDLFGDFIKYNPAFQSEGLSIQFLKNSISDVFSQKYFAYIEAPAYGNSVSEISEKTTIFTSPALSILISLFIAKLVLATSPLITYLLVITVCCFLIILSIFNLTRSSKFSAVGNIIAISFLFSYPLLFVISKGNYLSLITSTFLIFGFSLASRQKKIFSSILVSAAILMRPNLLPIIFMLPVAFFHYLNSSISKEIKIPLRRYFKSTSFVLGILVLSFLFFNLIAYQINSDFNLKNFYSAYSLYDKWYIVGNGGLAFGSSLFGMIKSTLMILFNKVSLDANIISLIKIFTYFSGFVFFFGALFGYLSGRFSFPSFSFFIASSILISTPVFADYHLLLFYVPLTSLFCSSYSDKSINFYSILIASNLMISPFTYYLRFDEFAFATLSVILRPIICIFFLLFIFKNSFSNDNKLVVKN